jgi:hydroxymethylglutaryl-CoA reductase (NADPH)
MRQHSFLSVPLRWVGPLMLRCGGCVTEKIDLPLATYETPLWASVHRGAKVSSAIGGIHALLLEDFMARSFLVRVKTASEGFELLKRLEKDLDIFSIAEKTSTHIKLLKIEGKLLGQSLFVRLCFKTGEASGHNMVTKATDAVLDHVVRHYGVQHISVSSNMCTDKKVSAINALKGRGKNVIVEGILSREICEKHLKTTPEALHDLNIRKNYLGSIAAGSLLSANAHYANMLLAFYLATGQDAANIVEASQGITTTDLIADPTGNLLHFAVHLPNLIVGTVGNGKDLPCIQENLKRLNLNCENGTRSQKLAMIIGGAVWCGELSLLAAQTNKGHLTEAHMRLERAPKKPCP